jgi:hypothetical protein
MPERSAFEYTILRVVPRVERGEFVNVGVVLFCRTRRFLAARIHLEPTRVLALAPWLDLEQLAEQLNQFPLVCAGGAAAGPIGALPIFERFRWLAAPRSTIIQVSPVHCGVCHDPALMLDHLLASMVLPLVPEQQPA